MCIYLNKIVKCKNDCEVLDRFSARHAIHELPFKPSLSCFKGDWRKYELEKNTALETAMLWPDLSHLPAERNLLRVRAWDFWCLMQLMMHTENTAERKCQKEELIEWHRSVRASLRQRGLVFFLFRPQVSPCTEPMALTWHDFSHQSPLCRELPHDLIVVFIYI